jgi:hypothetical protein
MKPASWLGSDRATSWRITACGPRPQYAFTGGGRSPRSWRWMPPGSSSRFGVLSAHPWSRRTGFSDRLLAGSRLPWRGRTGFRPGRKPLPAHHRRPRLRRLLQQSPQPRLRPLLATTHTPHAPPPLRAALRTIDPSHRRPAGSSTTTQHGRLKLWPRFTINRMSGAFGRRMVDGGWPEALRRNGYGHPGGF